LERRHIGGVRIELNERLEAVCRKLEQDHAVGWAVIMVGGEDWRHMHQHNWDGKPDLQLVAHPDDDAEGN